MYCYGRTWILCAEEYNVNMDLNEEVKQLRLQIEELSETLKKMDEKQNSQYTDILVVLKKVEGKVIDLESKVEHIKIRSDEELFERAQKVAVAAGKVSVPYLQRMLKIGEGRASKILNMLEERGIIGKSDGTKPREVLVKS